MPSPSERGTPRCVLCSMHCAIGAARDGLGHVSTVYPSDLGEAAGACVRALTAARLVDAPGRIFAGRSAGRDASSAQQVLEDVARATEGFGRERIALVVDLNRPLEGVLATARLCKEVGVRFAAHVPAEDRPLVAAGLTACAPFPDIADCDLLLAVGDPFSTHPAVARRVRDMQFGARGRRLVCVDTACGRTFRAANEAVAVGPAKLAAFLAALAIACGADAVRRALGGKDASAVCEAVGLPADRIDALAADMRDAESVGILLSNSIGRYTAPRAAAAAVGALSEAVGARVWPLLVATNSAALPALKKSLGACELGDVVHDVQAGLLDALMVIGFDPALVLPERLWRPLRDRCRVVCWAGSLPGPFGAAADYLVPLALPWEEGGTVLGADGKAAAAPAWLARPFTVLTVGELAGRLAQLAGVAPPSEAGVGDVAAAGPPRAGVMEMVGPDVLAAHEPEQGRALVVGAPEPQGYTGGISLAESSWQVRLASEERAMLSPDLAGAVGLAGDGAVELGDGAPGPVPCRAAPEGEGRAAALPAHWPALRELLEWRARDGALEAAPAPVDVRKA